MGRMLKEMERKIKERDEKEKADYTFSYYDSPISDWKKGYPKKSVTVEDVWNEIKSDKNKAKIETIRNEPTEAKQSKLKGNTLDFVSFGGVFDKREKIGLIKSSGLACFDIDHLTKQQLDNQIKLWWGNPYTHLLNKSSRGKGLKLVIKIPLVKNDLEYKQHYLAFSKLMGEYDINVSNDDVTKDISRACFVSYDPEAFFNPDSRIWTKKVKIEIPVYDEKDLKDIPKKCCVIEDIFCKKFIESEGDISKHKYIDSSVGCYTMDKPEQRAVYNQLQGRSNSAFNDCEKRGFSCDSVIAFGRKTKNQEIINKCQECEYFKKEMEIKEEKKEEKQEEYGKEMDMVELKERVLMHMVKKERAKATEEMTQAFLNKEHIYTTRDDEKPEMWVYCREGINKGIYVPNGKTYIKEFVRKLLDWSFTQHIANEVIEKIEVESYVDQDIFFSNNDVWNIPVENGIMNLESRELKPFTPKKIFFNKLPVFYDKDKKCKKFENHLDLVLETKEEKMVLQELFGFCLLKEYKFEKGFMFTGDGRNGKGKTLEVLKRFLGAKNCVSIPLQRLEFKEDKNALGELHNKLANLGGDIGSKSLYQTSNFKTTTGRDMVSANRKWKTMVHFVSFAKHVFCANELPKTYDMSTAFFERWILINFPYTFLPQKEIDIMKIKNKNILVADTGIAEKLTTPEELSGILNFALVGLDRLLKQEDFSDSKTMKDIKDTWVRKSDSFTAFMMDCTIEDYDFIVKKGDMAKYYSMYCKHFKLKPRGTKEIKETLERDFGATEGRYTHESKSITCWEGVKLVICKVSEGSEGFPITLRDYISSSFGKTLTSLTTLTKQKKPPKPSPNLDKEQETLTQNTTKEDILKTLKTQKKQISTKKLMDLIDVKDYDDLIDVLEILKTEELVLEPRHDYWVIFK